MALSHGLRGLQNSDTMIVGHYSAYLSSMRSLQTPWCGHS